jgi:signal transduction histidine kinase
VVAVTFRAAAVEAPGSIFAPGEDLEFRHHDREAAIATFRRLTISSDAAVRAGALVRLGRNLHAAGRAEEALSVYAKLAEIDGVSVAGAPAGLIGRYAACKLLDEGKRPQQLRAEGERLEHALRSGRWALSGPIYALYAGDAARWSGGPVAEAFVPAVEALWERWNSMPPSGRASLELAESFSVLWQTTGGSFRALIACPRFVESHWIGAIAPLTREHRIALSLRDRSGNSILRAPMPAGARSATRRSLEAGLPWNVVVASTDPLGHDRDFVVRRRLLVAGFILLVSMALAASYLIFRAVSRELAVARLQSDFVAAVSHEFRTPLTALRQFTDMLREHGGLADDRRRVCYEAQSRATDRLTRLVEALLDFGRMEAGARVYRFERHECTALVRRVVDDFRTEIEPAGYEIGFNGNGSAPIDADAEALGRALWNLLDNAVKYSPDHPVVDVGIELKDASVRIAVRDRGIGIPRDERDLVFARFRRGAEARRRGIQGTGIGLAMVDHIVKAHGGQVELESEPGAGSTFTIVLPVRE